jgi:predicted glycoside hydrolase/deacetylase ChbG (UPF0249 family)
MAVGRAFEHAVDLWRSYPALDVGVHLTLVAEKPLLERNSSLTGKDGCLPPNIPALLKHLLNKRVQLTDIQAEWSAQIERILNCGIRLTHLDSHQHLHALPGIAQLTMNLARRYHIPFVRIPMEDRMVARPIGLYGTVRMAGAMTLRASCLFAHLNQGRVSGFESPRFLGFYEGGRLDLKSLERILLYLKPGRVYELMSHPGFTPKEPEIESWNYNHHTELETLTSPSIRSLIADCNIRVCSFADLLVR